MSQESPLFARLLKFRGHLLNLWIVLLGLLFGGLLTETVQAAVFEGKTSLWLAALVFLLWVAEYFLLPLKLRDVFARADYSPEEKPLHEGLLVGGLLFRLTLDVLLLRIFVDSLGWKLDTNKTLFLWIVLFLLLKSFVGYILMLRAKKQPRALPESRSLWLDVFFLTFYTLLYALYWDVVTDNVAQIRTREMALLYVDLFGAAVVFCLLFFPVRLPYLMEELLRKRTWKETLALLLTFVGALFVAILPLYQGARKGRYEQLQKALQHPTGVKKLYLQRKKLTTLPPRFTTLTKTRVLSLYGNRLTCLPNDFGKLSALESLDLMFNRLTRLPESMGDLKRLKKLRLYKNQLTSLPASIGMLQALETLDLQYNRLQQLPDSFAQLKNLRVLRLDHNQFTQFPKVLCKLPRLRVIRIQHNRIQTLPSCFRRFSKLHYVNLYGNPVYKRWLKRQRAKKRRKKK